MSVMLVGGIEREELIEFSGGIKREKDLMGRHCRRGGGLGGERMEPEQSRWD